MGNRACPLLGDAVEVGVRIPRVRIPRPKSPDRGSVGDVGTGRAALRFRIEEEANMRPMSSEARLLVVHSCILRV